MVKCKAGGSQAAIDGKLLHGGFSLSGEMLEFSVYQKNQKIILHCEENRNKGREAATNFHHVGHGFLDV